MREGYRTVAAGDEYALIARMRTIGFDKDSQLYPPQVEVRAALPSTDRGVEWRCEGFVFRCLSIVCIPSVGPSVSNRYGCHGEHDGDQSNKEQARHFLLPKPLFHDPLCPGARLRNPDHIVSQHWHLPPSRRRTA